MDWKGDDVGYFSFGVWLEEISPVCIVDDGNGGKTWFLSSSSFFCCCSWCNFVNDGMASRGDLLSSSRAGGKDVANNMEAPSDDGMVLDNNDLLEVALEGGVGLRLGEREREGEKG